MRVCFTGGSVSAFRDSVSIDEWNPAFPVYCRNGSFIRHTSKLKPKYCQGRHRYLVESPGRYPAGQILGPGSSSGARQSVGDASLSSPQALMLCKGRRNLYDSGGDYRKPRHSVCHGLFVHGVEADTDSSLRLRFERFIF